MVNKPTVYQEKRTQANLTQEKASECLGISTRNLQYIETGEREPKISVAFKMAELYECNILDFRQEAVAKGERGIMTRFSPVRTPYPSLKKGGSCSYGILAEEYDGNKWTQVAIVPDVSSSEEFAAALAEKCTKGRLSAIHILDVIADATT